MPELPEVETSRRGIEPYLVGETIAQIHLHHQHLRWPIPQNIPEHFKDQIIRAVLRRGKYLLLITDVGSLILHLGMSGSLRIVSPTLPLKKHDHVELICANGFSLRFNDPRRFGCLLYTVEDPLQHTLLKTLGVEPLSTAFNTDYLFKKTRNKHVAIKQLIMNSKIVVGVGNIYANEALFKAGISPLTAAGQLTRAACQQLTRAIKTILNKAITVGGTTLKNFNQADGKPGYFKQKLQVYGRANQPCLQCEKPLTLIQLGGRQTVYCVDCQA
jgi:formamidopyrimidine-DNA glycosylase